MARGLRSEEVDALLARIVAAFGYPASSMQGLLERLKSHLSFVSLYPGDSVEELLVDELMKSVWWEESLEVDEEDPYAAEGTSQSTLKLAAQWSGLFGYEDGLGFGKSGFRRAEERVRYYADVNPGSQGTVVLAQLDEDGEPTMFPGVVFTSLLQHGEAESEHRFLQTERLKVDEGSLTHKSFKQQVDGFARRYPHFVSLCGHLLGEDFSVPVVKLPRLSEKAVQSLECLSLATFVARVLGSEEVDEPPARLLELAASERSDRDSVPELLLRPLGRLVLGDEPGAARAAREILEEDLGVPLTRRWAQRVLDRPSSSLLGA